MKAEEARKLTQQVTSGDGATARLSDVLNRIKRAAGKGESSVQVTYRTFGENSAQRVGAKNHLERLGYQVKYFDNHDPRDQREQAFYVISW